MDPNEVKITRLTRNLISLSEDVSEFSAAEARRYAAIVADARKAGELSVRRVPKGKDRARAAVVAWDLAHNPAGRAHVLYELLKEDWDVDLIGPMWSRYGSEIWAPLRNSGLNVRSFNCSNISDFVPQAEVLATGRHYDMVCVCKPRLPSLYLGALIKEASGCPLVLDVDDFELSFFNDESYASVEEFESKLHVALHEPFEELATRYAQTLVPAADAITVSNVALRARFGGHIVRHARDEAQFVNSEARRQCARERLGIKPDEFALMFVGTPRPHKGVLDVAAALHGLKDSSIVFHIVGDIPDECLRQQLVNFSDARIVLHPDCAFGDLPDFLAGADLVPLIQDVEHAISQYQIPAKVSDALSLGIPVVATRTSPLADLIASGAIHETDAQGLADVIVRIKAQTAQGQRIPQTTQERRNFVGELGLEVNRARLKLVIAEARQQHEADAESSTLTPVQEAKAGDSMPESLAQMVVIVRNHYRGLRGEELRISRERRGETQKPEKLSGLARTFNKARFTIGSRVSRYDIAFFWKQNDSDLFGRRSDMIAQELVRSGRVRKMIRFDAPMSVLSLNERFDNPSLARDHQQDLIVSNLVERQMGIFDTAKVRNRTHVYSPHPGAVKFMGQDVQSKGSYVRYVNEQLEAHGMRARNTIAWFCPVIWDAPELIEKIGFRQTIADLIDDQRAWDTVPAYRSRLDKSYRDTLGAADLVFANCESLAEAMQQYASGNIHVIPNGAERYIRFPEAPIPESLKNISGPVVGYVGNLRDRIDWTLLHEVVPAMPDVSFVFFGPSDNNANADSLAKYDNVHVPGVVRYEELASHLRCLDVGLVPHLNNQLTERMNPLKVYNYFAAGLPIVSTELANLEDLGDALKLATTAQEFIAAIRASIENPVDTASTQWQSTMDQIAWESRVGSILEVMDQTLHRKLRKTA